MLTTGAIFVLWHIRTYGPIKRAAEGEGFVSQSPDTYRIYKDEEILAPGMIEKLLFLELLHENPDGTITGTLI